MTPFLRPYFAAAAEREVAAREKHYPAMIDAGTIERGDADADLDAWRTIATLFRDGAAETELTWAPLVLATSRALQRCEEDLAEKPESAIRRARRDAVWGIYERLKWHQETIERINGARILAPAEAAPVLSMVEG